jgi:hypothetical protein
MRADSEGRVRWRADAGCESGPVVERSSGGGISEWTGGGMGNKSDAATMPHWECLAWDAGVKERP